MTDAKGPKELFRPIEKELFRPIEVEGRRWMVSQRTTDGKIENSFDAGETWHENAAEAYRTAKRAGTLVPEKPQPGEAPEELVGVVQELLRHIRSLEPGEELRVSHTGNAIVVLKHRAVLSFRPSALEDGGIERAQEDEDDG